MQTTMNLLANALEKAPAPDWHKKLGLNRNALHNAKLRGNLSPAIAGALAYELGDDPIKWMAIAAIEGEKESPVKAFLQKKLFRPARE